MIDASAITYYQLVFRTAHESYALTSARLSSTMARRSTSQLPAIPFSAADSAIELRITEYYSG
jgi:hypothetical protein